jgi:hypothetical protein
MQRSGGRLKEEEDDDEVVASALLSHCALDLPSVDDGQGRRRADIPGRNQCPLIDKAEKPRVIAFAAQNYFTMKIVMGKGEAPGSRLTASDSS